MIVAALSLSGCVMPDGQQTHASDAETVHVADAALSVGDYQEAARLYERAAEQRPGSVAPYIGMGRAYSGLGQLARAESALARAAALRPSDPSVYNELGHLALQRMQPAEALAQYNKALSRDSKNLGALTGKAIALDMQSDHAGAQAVYDRALALYPTNFALLNNKGVSLVLSGRAAEGTVLLEELVRDAERGATARANLAIAYTLAGRSRDARAMLTGIMSPAEVEATLRQHKEIYAAARAGKPIGHLVF